MHLLQYAKEMNTTKAPLAPFEDIAAVVWESLAAETCCYCNAWPTCGPSCCNTPFPECFGSNCGCPCCSDPNNCQPCCG